MIGLSHVRGQPRVVDLLRRALSQGRVPHAYLFCGAPGSGKHTTGLALAAALNCEREPGEGCGACDTCERIESGRHPDVVTLEREGAAQIIPIQTIRTRVMPAMGLAPHEAKARVFLIEEGAALQGPAANALLKTLEEPPARTHFVLCTAAPDQLLPTIRSRCQRVSFQPLPPDVRAELAGEDEAAAHLGRLADRLFEAAERDDVGSLLEAAAEAGKERSEVAPVISLFAQRLHDAAVEAAGRDELDRAAVLARRATLAFETEASVTLHNAHGQLALERLLHQIRTRARV